MVRLLKDETLIAKWTAFIEEHYKSDLETIALEYPDKHSLTIDYLLLDEELASPLITQPYKSIFNAEYAIHSIDTVHGNLDIKLRIKNMDDILPCIPPNKLRARHIGQFVSVDGFVKNTTAVKPRVEIAAFQCNKCGVIIKIDQTETVLVEPPECYEDQGGCGRVSSFRLSSELSTKTDFQKVSLQERPEDIKPGEQAEKVVTYLEDDIVRSVVPGDRVVFTGILQMQPKRVGGKLSTVYNTFLDVNHIQIKHTAYSSVDLSDADIKEIKKLAKSSTITDDICGSIAPSVFGHTDIKRTVMLQLFGSDSFTHKDGTFRRGDVHVLLMGDPGIAKSIILESACLLSPRAIFIEGPLASGAGLTAAAVQDEFGEGQWSIEAGALPQADLGFAVIDEFEKMNDDDRNKVHRAMEQQKITVTKAGQNVTLNTRCAILAAANPKNGSFDVMEPLMPQVDLPATIISRFDALFLMRDEADLKTDRELAKRIVHANANPESVDAAISVEMIKKYVSYAKDNIHPTIPPGLEEHIADFYSKLRAELASDKDAGVTPRQIESVIRFSKAKARLHLRNEVTLEDVQYAITVLESSYNTRIRENAALNYTIDRVVT